MKRAPSPSLLGVGAALCVLLGAMLAVWFGGRGLRTAEPPPAASEIPPAAPPARQVRPVLSPDPNAVRAEIERATTRALEDVKPADLEGYLASLERRARAQGRVTALEVQPGMALAESLTGDPERARQFARRMETVQRELSAPRAGAAPSPSRQAAPATPSAVVDALAGRIGAESDGPRRQVLIREYLEAAQALTDEEEAMALKRLGRIPGVLPPAPAVASPDDLYRAIGAAEPAHRQAAIARYLEAVEGLPDEEERARRLRDLERRQGPP
jgi:hypothetical protein